MTAIYLIAYGDAEGNGRGLYVLSSSNTGIEKLGFYPTLHKPGALIVVNNQLWLSYVEADGGAGISLYSIDGSGLLTFQKNVATPYFFTYFSPAIQPDQILACSFYQGIDVLISVQSPDSILSEFTHTLTEPGSDPRQKSCHAHFIAMTPDQKYAYSADLGSDEIVMLRLKDNQLAYSPKHSLVRPLASGPRLMPFRPDGRFAYLLNEISNSITVFSYDKRKFNEIQTISTLSSRFENADGATSSAAGFRISQNGQFLLVSNRGENSIVCFSIDAESGLLSEVSRISCGILPRDILIIDKHVLVAAQDSNKVESYYLNDDGVLATGADALNICSPVGLYLP